MFVAEDGHYAQELELKNKVKSLELSLKSVSALHKTSASVPTLDVCVQTVTCAVSTTSQTCARITSGHAAPSDEAGLLKCDAANQCDLLSTGDESTCTLMKPASDDEADYSLNECVLRSPRHRRRRRRRTEKWTIQDMVIDDLSGSTPTPATGAGAAPSSVGVHLSCDRSVFKDNTVQSVRDSHKQRVLLLGDSYSHNLSGELRSILPSEYEVSSICRPGAPLSALLQSLAVAPDYLILSSGSVDIAFNDLKKFKRDILRLCLDKSLKVQL
ncbi:unnamed protein product, partial [Nesidiocoris tenuis]